MSVGLLDRPKLFLYFQFLNFCLKALRILKNSWKILFQLPVTLLMIVMLVEVCMLEQVKPNRHDLDRLAIVADQANADITSNIVIIGDSDSGRHRLLESS